MKLEDWFHTLQVKAETIERQWPDASEHEKLQLADQLFQLRKVSDRLVDLWLQFEEKLSYAIRQIKKMEGQEEPQADNLQEFVYQDMKDTEPKVPTTQQEETATAYKEPEAALAGEASTGGQATATTGTAATMKKDSQLELHREYEHMFRKGEGFYHLRMYQDAKTCFQELVQASPDWESGRLYYGYSLLFCGEKEGAMREFRLLSRSASSPSITAISYNAIGCILAEESQWLEAAQAFKEAVAVLPKHRDAWFNLALCYLNDGDVHEALDAVEKVLDESDQDWEAQMLWLRALRALQSRDSSAEREAPAGLSLPNRNLDSETLREMASLYESLGNYHRAQVCYHFLTDRLPKEGWTWHGLAWNTWLIAGTRRALTLMKKAISLAPNQLDFQFSYGWMLLFDGKVDEAFAVFRAILLRERDHRLAQSGMITAYEWMGEIQAAKKLAKPFIEDADTFVRSLGCYHLGRISMAEENWRLAEQYFRRVLPHSDHFREIPFYLQMCANKLGEPLSESELFHT
ncbi:tetratricopeptide repeat protein [Brevibacillus ruminantium]|uniref:Tetratricopeptide repeat protein n=1 Tax=Brevibacillus ruminantium TaxID=2950604 RepID=A0ABY4W978_9BACL|nr:tetratricopeptide repeat protein [Brevibacillus ruminantium]USG63474.1 tetratricopeptide repeat protein [Brevibacillus ruminantium]